MTVTELRAKYLEFWQSKNHAIIPSASLIPQNDPTTLFTSSGMQPMITYLLGEPHPEGTRITDSQKCFRAEDIDEVGDNRHTTLFEMLGNWSLGDYFKKEQLTWLWEFLTQELKLDPNKLYVTVFSGNNEIPIDQQAIETWQQLFTSAGIEAKLVHDSANLGMQAGKIFTYPEKKNWWSRSGVPSKMPAGEPGGPDSEVFYEFTQIEHDPSFGPHCHVNCDCGRYLEIGNSVFMQFQKQSDGSFKELPQKNIDFGGGLERLLSALNNNPDMFLSDSHFPIIQKIETMSGKSYTDSLHTKHFRIIADHIKAAAMLAADGVIPSNKMQGYMMRRLIRRAVASGNSLGLAENFTAALVAIVQDMYADQYLEIQGEIVPRVIVDEELKFRQTLEKGIREVHREQQEVQKLNAQTDFANLGLRSFNLFQSSGIPIDITLDVWEKSFGFSLDERQQIQEEYAKVAQAHRELSRSASAGMFKGGLAEHSEITTQYHTATHLLHQALRDVLGDHVVQRGSNINAERLRFDFTHDTRLTSEQITQVESIVNQKIKAALPVSMQQVSREDGYAAGSIGLFGEKYPDTVNVYTIGPAPINNQLVPRDQVYSREFCGGPHVTNTSEIKGTFKIQKDEKIAKDVVRIKAILQ